MIAPLIDCFNKLNLINLTQKNYLCIVLLALVDKGADDLARIHSCGFPTNISQIAQFAVVFNPPMLDYVESGE